MVKIIETDTPGIFNIELTRGDSLFLNVGLTNQDGTPYVPAEGDHVRFALKKKYTDLECLILKQIPTETMVLELEPSDTKNLQFSSYDFDIELTDANDHVSTPILGTLKLTKEVH